MAKKIKKLRKKLSKKTPRRKAGSSRAKKAKKKNTLADIIYDSTEGKTDALFVSVPDLSQPAQQPAVLPQLDPAITEALNEFDVSEETQKPVQEDNTPQNQAGQIDQLDQIPAAPVKPKTFLGKMLSIQVKLFLILISLALVALLSQQTLQPQQQALKEQPGSVGDLIKEVASGLSAGTWDFSKWILTAPVRQAAAGIINNSVTLKSGLPTDNTKLFVGGLLEPIKEIKFLNSEKSGGIEITRIENSYSPDKDIIVAGRAQKNSDIILSWNGQLGLTKAGSNGKWIVNLGKMPEGKYSLQLVANDSLKSSSITAAQLSVSKGNIFGFFTAGISSVLQKTPAQIILVPEDTPEVLQGKWDLMK